MTTTLEERREFGITDNEPTCPQFAEVVNSDQKPYIPSPSEMNGM
jgi:hypothetical protein